MKEIKIEFEFSTVMIGKVLENATELELVLDVGAEKAELFDDSEKTISVNKDDFLNIWNNFSEINYAKILQENENMMGLDGYDLVTHLNTGMTELSVSLFSPSEEEFMRRNCTESAAFMRCINQIIKIASENGIKTILS